MTERRFHDALKAATPDVPEVFHQTMEETLGRIAAQETGALPARKPTPRLRKRFAVALVAAMLVVAVAVAAVLRPDVLTAFWGEVNVTEDMRGIIRRNLAGETIGNYTVRIEEAAWDGVSLYVLYSIRDNTCTTLLGKESAYDPSGRRYLSEEETQRFENVGWWTDTIWINGEDVDIPGGTTWYEYGGDKPGEVLFYQLWPLGWPVGGEPLTLHGQVTFSLPIGERQAMDTLKRNENGGFALPEKGVLSFALDTDALSGVRKTAMKEETVFPDGTAVRVSEATFSPVKTYVTLDYQVPQQTMDAYIAQNGPGFTDENGTVLFPYTAADLVTSWAYDLVVTDESGERVFDSTPATIDGLQGLGDQQIWYLLPPMEDAAKTLYLCPLDESGKPDMTRKIKLQ